MYANSAAQMLAATYQDTGPAEDVLIVRSIDRPEPGPGEVRVRMAVSAVNPTDVKSRAGITPRAIADFQVPHMDGAGTIDAVGEGVAPARLGERVWVMLAALQPWGTAAQWSVVPEHRAIPLPDHASFELGATLGVPAMTAAHCLLADGPIGGKDVLVAGVGAVGRAAIQLAHWAGARVIATVSSEHKARLAIAAGADHVVNYKGPSAAEQIREWSPSGVDRVIEVALGPNLDLNLAVCAPGSTIVVYAIDGPDPVIPVRRCMAARIVLRFMLLYSIPDEAMARAMAMVTAALDDGALDLAPHQRFPLADIVSAHHAQEAGPVGRILIDIPAHP
jgi:NADPH2:quinone reductase